jgi:hypothetical protein
MSITYSGPSGYAGICNGANVTVLNCNWNTKKLRAGVYTLNASASDAMGNGSNASISVELVESGTGGGGGGGGRCHPRKGC